MRTNRTAFVVVLLVSLMSVLVVSACAGPSKPGKPLLILEWSGYEATEYPEFFEPFTEKYGDDLEKVVSYSIFGDDSEALAKMRTGFEADLVHPCSSWWGLYVSEGLVQPIDTSRLSNWADISPQLAEMGQFDGKQYFIPWEWGYDSILVRTDLVDEVPDAWADLWDPAYAGHVAVWDSGEIAYVVAALALGLDPWETTPEQDVLVKEKLLALKPNLLTYWSDYTQSYDLPASGDAWLVANAWQDAYAYLLEEGYPVAYINPVEGRLGWVCGYAISAESENLDLAYEFLDAAIAPESMAAMADVFWYGFANEKAADLVDPAVTELLNMTDVEAYFRDTVFYRSLTEEQRSRFVTLWDEVKAAP
jgi:spermidine/putrescine transport system substrate-binding protein